MSSALLPSVPLPSVRKLRVMMTDALDTHAPAMRNLTILGSTGSIGTNSLDVVRRSRQSYQVFALAAGRNTSLLASQIQEFRPKVAVLPSTDSVAHLSHHLEAVGLSKSEWPELLAGPHALVQIATAPECDT